MTLKLFHVTEFAESAWVSPEKQREAIHPVTLLLLTSLWLVSAYNMPLWRELSRLPLGTGQLWWLGLRLGLLMVLALTALLSLLCWRRIFKLALALLLLLAALNAPLMWHQANFFDLGVGLANLAAQLRAEASWQFVGLFLALGLLPGLWLWRLPVRRIPLPAKLLQNALLLVLSCVLLVGTWWLSAHDISELLRSQPQLHRLLNPLSSLQTLVPEQLARFFLH